MHNKTDVFLVDAHSECRCSYDTLHLIFQKTFLVGDFFYHFHFSMEGKGRDAISLETQSNFLRSVCS